MRYSVAGVSGAGAVSNNTNLFSVQAVTASSAAAPIYVRGLTVGVEGASTFAQGPLEIGVFTINAGYTTSGVTTVTPLPQELNGTPFANLYNPAVIGVGKAWTLAPTKAATPSVRRSASVLSELSWPLEMLLVINGSPSSGGIMVATIGNSNSISSGLAVSWTVTLEV